MESEILHIPVRQVQYFILAVALSYSFNGFYFYFYFFRLKTQKICKIIIPWACGVTCGHKLQFLSSPFLAFCNIVICIDLFASFFFPAFALHFPSYLYSYVGNEKNFRKTYKLRPWYLHFEALLWVFKAKQLIRKRVFSFIAI